MDKRLFASIHTVAALTISGVLLMHSEQLQRCREILTSVKSPNTFDLPMNNQILLTVISAGLLKGFLLSF